MPRAKKRFPGETRDAAGQKKKSRGAGADGGVSRAGSDSGMEKIKLKAPPFLGELLFSGGTNWDLVGRSRLPKSSAGKQLIGGRNLWGPHRMAVLSGIKVRSVISGPTACHSIIITEAGKAMSWGRGDKGQLGHGDLNRCEAPKLIEGLKEFTIVNAACGRNHTMCLTEEGVVYAFGDNKLGQLGIGHQNTPIPTPNRLMYSGRPIVKVACGGEFTMILDYKGTLHSFGCPEYSQLGHNTNGQYFVTSNKTSFDCVLTPRRIGGYIEKNRDGIKFLDNIVIKDVACGANHTVALDMQGRVFTWGFGGYGRLGHSEPRDEPIPRFLKTFDPSSNRAAKMINAGTCYSMAKTDHEQLFFWGQTKSTGEATMYPKTVQDLSGWKVRGIGCSNHSIVLIADDSIISWGPSPTFGELCYGENGPRSSCQAKEVKPLENIHIHALTCGLGHTLLIAKNDTVEDRRKLRAMPLFNPTGVPVNESPLEEEEDDEEEEEVQKLEEIKSEVGNGAQDTDTEMKEAKMETVAGQKDETLAKDAVVPNVPEKTGTTEREAEVPEKNGEDEKTAMKDADAEMKEAEMETVAGQKEEALAKDAVAPNAPEETGTTAREAEVAEKNGEDEKTATKDGEGNCPCESEGMETGEIAARRWARISSITSGPGHARLVLSR
ncbi:protein RCC2 homolog [Acanthaster planci]|uniref:Protein RCC2 homolog n=1 Tax=Acanthaster planci TaxID=133434 RepID=A0A8B7Y0D8_ACAPL|nr:protein RCC2 homolog [Acanthaster planci]